MLEHVEIANPYGPNTRPQGLRGGAERTHEEPIHRPPQYHLDELRDFRRSHAQAVPLLDRDAQPARPGADGLPTAVDDDRRAELYQSPGASGHPVRAIELVAADLDDSR